MVYLESEIFDEYVKSAEENGLILKEAGYEDARVGSDDKEKIENLYQVKPNEKDEDILDDAHPETHVASPAYDRMNGIVENLKERQDIISYIARKEPNGYLTQHRYVEAKKDLVDSLVSVGFFLDSKNDEGLAKFADQCAGELTKEAGIPVAAVGAIAKAWPYIMRAGMLFLGYTGITQVIMDPVSQGVLNDVENSIVELREASSKVYPATASEMNAIIGTLTDFKQLAEKYLSIDPIQLDPNKASMADVLKLRNDPKALEKMRMARAYLQGIQTLRVSLPSFVSKLESVAEKETNLPSFLSPLAEIKEMFIDPSELDDAIKQLKTLQGSLEKEAKRLQAEISKGQAQATEMAVRMKDILNKAMRTETPTAQPTPQQQGALTQLVQQAEELKVVLKEIDG